MALIGIVLFFLVQLFLIASALKQTKLTSKVNIGKAFMLWIWIVVYTILAVVLLEAFGLLTGILTTIMA